MKYFLSLILISLTILLSGCAGLSINADFYGSYRSDVPLGDRNK